MLYSSCVLRVGTPPRTGGWGAKEGTNLAGCIDNLGCEVLALETYSLTKRVFNCRVVAVDEVAIDKLDR